MVSQYMEKDSVKSPQPVFFTTQIVDNPLFSPNILQIKHFCLVPCNILVGRYNRHILYQRVVYTVLRPTSTILNED